MNHLLKASVCWMANFQIHPIQRSIIISTKYLINSIMHLSKARNRRVLSSILWQKLQKPECLIFIISTISPDRKQTKEPLCFKRKCFKKKLLLRQAHHTIEISLSVEMVRKTMQTHNQKFAASMTFSVVLALYICFRKGWSYICVFLPVMCQMGSFSNVCCCKTQSCLKQHRAPGSSPLWCYSWTQISAASVPVAHSTFNVQSQRRRWSSVLI